MSKEKRASKKRSSWGCVQRVAQGKYRLRWMEDGKRRTETLYGTRREADDRMAEIRTRVGSGPSKRPVTVGEAYERWYLPAVEQSAAPNTLANTRSSWRTHVSPRWAAVPLDDVRPADVQVWLLALTRWQAELALRVLRGVYREASIYGLASSDPTSVRYRMPDRVEHARSRDVIGTADMEAYWEAASSCGLGAMFVLAACCGLRVGEGGSQLGLTGRVKGGSRRVTRGRGGIARKKRIVFSGDAAFRPRQGVAESVAGRRVSLSEGGDHDEGSGNCGCSEDHGRVCTSELERH